MLVDSSLKSIILTIYRAQDIEVLRTDVMEEIGAHFAAARWSMYFVQDLPVIDKNTPELLQRALSLESNRVLRYLVERHAVVHDEVVLPPGVWKTICPRADHGHVMLGPIVSDGELLAGVAVTRFGSATAFNNEDLADLSAICLHLSARVSLLRSQAGTAISDHSHLTSREKEIAELVAKGLTNKDIGRALWITENSVKQALKRMFRKLGVSSRAEMVASLAQSRSRTA